VKNRIASVSLAVILAASVGLAGCGCEELLEMLETSKYNLTLSSTEGGSVTTPGEGTYAYYGGTVVNLVAEAQEGYHLANWIGDVGTIANINSASTTITMQGNYSITANFEDIPNYDPISSSTDLVYNLAAYYVYRTGSLGSPENYPEWREDVTTYVEYEANLITAYVQQHGISGGMPLVSVEAFEMDSTYFSGNTLEKPTLINALKLLPSWADSDVQVVVGSWDAGTNACAMGTTAFVYLTTIQADVKAMKGDPDPIYANRVYCQLAHEFGHVFGCAEHCANKPCPMAQQYISYTEWVNMGQTLWFCDAHKSLFLVKWQRGL
jgi:hypothetical protein